MMVNLWDHFGLAGGPSDPAAGADHAMRMAALCQQVENRIVGAPCGIMDQVTSLYGRPGELLRLLCQPHELKAPLVLPEGIRVLGIGSGVKHNVGGRQYGATRCAAFMGREIILGKMRELGEAAGTPMTADPIGGYLANLDPADYKRFFRPYLPESIKGIDFLNQYGPTSDKATVVHPDHDYLVQRAVDHHVLDSRRIRNFVEFIEEARQHPTGSREKMVALDKAGHLMYASHISYTEDAMLGADECDLLVQLVREREGEGFYGARITAGGSGGTVAVLANTGERTDAAVKQIMEEYTSRTGKSAIAFLGSSPGAWHVGTHLI
jgi:galactokinase